MPTYIDIETWERREAFAFFKDFDHPFFGITTRVDVTALVAHCKRTGRPFASAALFLLLHTANGYAPMRLRIEGERVVLHDRIHPSTTELAGGTEKLVVIGFDHADTFAGFDANFQAARQAALTQTEFLNDRDKRPDTLHYSMVPWLDFTSVQHARNLSAYIGSEPKIVFGKHVSDGEGRSMSVSVECHHALMDGGHVAQFLRRLQAAFDDADTLLGASDAPADDTPRRTREASSGDADLDGIVDFLMEAERLKDTLRSGYTSEGRQESVAAHTWRLVLMAALLGSRDPSVDVLALIKMLLIHDLGEALHGDIPAPEQVGDNADKGASERRDFVALLATLPTALAQELTELWDDYEFVRTPEAKLAKALDKLETLLQHVQGKNPPDFDYGFNLDYGRKYTAAPDWVAALRGLLDEETARRRDER